MGQRKGEIMSNIDKYETRKKMVYDFMCDDMYVPMKIKELCIVLGVKKEDRPQLEQILLYLQAFPDVCCCCDHLLLGHKKSTLT